MEVSVDPSIKTTGSYGESISWRNIHFKQLNKKLIEKHKLGLIQWLFQVSEYQIPNMY